MTSTSRCLLLVLFVGACRDAPANNTVRVVVDTINGIERVHNTGQPSAWTLEELVTIGTAAESGGAQEFGAITGVIADAQHNIYVADQQAREIRVFDEQGRLLRRIGRSGSGPGEFLTLQSVGWLGDTMVTMDWRNLRLGLLAADGTWLGQRAMPPISGGAIRLFQTGPAELYSLAMQRVADRMQTVFVRHTPSGAADTVPVPPNPTTTVRTVVCRYGGAISFFTPGFAPLRVREPAPNATLLDYWNGEYRLNIMRPPDTLRIIERDLPRIPVDDAEWSREEARFRAWRDSLPADRNCQPAALPRPETKSLLRAVFFDDQNQTWIERRAGEAHAFDVLDARGGLIAQLDAPPRHVNVPVHVRGDRLYLVTTDSLDVQYVKAYRIVRADRRTTEGG